MGIAERILSIFGGSQTDSPNEDEKSLSTDSSNTAATSSGVATPGEENKPAETSDSPNEEKTSHESVSRMRETDRTEERGDTALTGEDKIDKYLIDLREDNPKVRIEAEHSLLRMANDSPETLLPYAEDLLNALEDARNARATAIGSVIGILSEECPDRMHQHLDKMASMVDHPNGRVSESLSASFTNFPPEVIPVDPFIETLGPQRRGIAATIVLAHIAANKPTRVEPSQLEELTEVSSNESKAQALYLLLLLDAGSPSMSDIEYIFNQGLDSHLPGFVVAKLGKQLLMHIVSETVPKGEIGNVSIAKKPRTTQVKIEVDATEPYDRNELEAVLEDRHKFDDLTVKLKETPGLDKSVRRNGENEQDHSDDSKVQSPESGPSQDTTMIADERSGTNSVSKDVEIEEPDEGSSISEAVGAPPDNETGEAGILTEIEDEFTDLGRSRDGHEG